LADVVDDGVVVGKKDPAFFGDFCVADPHTEFAAASFDQFYVDPEFIFDGGRRTGGPGSIRRSDFTETNAHVVHNILQFHDSNQSLQILPKKFQRAFPGELGRLGVVAWCRVVVKSMLLTFVHKAFELFIVRFQGRLVGFDAFVHALVIAGVVKHQRCLDLGHVSDTSLATVERDAGV
jgi:hypothetical protein